MGLELFVRWQQSIITQRRETPAAQTQIAPNEHELARAGCFGRERTIWDCAPLDVCFPRCKVEWKWKHTENKCQLEPYAFGPCSFASAADASRYRGCESEKDLIQGTSYTVVVVFGAAARLRCSAGSREGERVRDDIWRGRRAFYFHQFKFLPQSVALCTQARHASILSIVAIRRAHAGHRYTLYHSARVPLYAYPEFPFAFPSFFCHGFSVIAVALLAHHPLTHLQLPHGTVQFAAPPHTAKATCAPATGDEATETGERTGARRQCKRTRAFHLDVEERRHVCLQSRG